MKSNRFTDDFKRTLVTLHKEGKTLRELQDAYGVSSSALCRWVLQDEQIRSVELLMQEQMPTGVPLLVPGEEETRGTRRESDFPVQVVPWEEPITSHKPRMHLLSNGNFTTILSNWGGGFSRWKGIDLTRWHADGVLEPWGTWIYIQDLDKKKGDTKFKTWSAADQPIPGNPDNSQVNFFAHMAVFKRTENDLTSTMEVTVAPDDPLEIRRIHMINNTPFYRHLRFTSYGEVIFNTLAADTRHPAYNNLFIESEFVPELNLLIFKDSRQPASKQPVFLGHMLVIKEPRFRRIEHNSIRYETDRRAFVGRDCNLHAPEALHSEAYLTGTTGSTLNPIFSLGREIYLRPHETFSLAYITFTAQSKTALLRMAERYSVWTQTDDTFQKSNISNLVWLGRQKLGREELKSILDLFTLLVYPLGQKRADPGTLSKNVLTQAGLWRFGISGDYPIILLEINEPQQLNILIDVIKAQNFLRTHGYQTDLVILNTQPSMYSSELNDMIIRRIRLVEADQWLNQPSGIFIRKEDQMRMEEHTLLRSVAKVIVFGNRGSLAEQLRVTQKPTSDLPHLFTTLQSRRNLPPTENGFSKLKSDLQFYNGYGGFSPDGREYILILPPGKTTPAPWINVIGYPNFGFMVSQSGSQTTWAINSGENRISPWSNDPVSDPSGEALYLRDEESGDIWTPTPLPASGGQAHLVRHGAGYSIFESESHGLRQEMTVFASPEDPVKIVHLRIKNSLNETRRLTATYYLEWVLGLTHEDTYPMLIPEYNPAHSMLRVRNPYHAELGNQIVFLMAKRSPHGFTTDRMEFLGRRGSTADPAALHRIGLSNNVTVGIDTCAAMQLHLDLDPNGEDELYFVVGAANDEDHLDFLANKYRRAGVVAATLEKTDAFWKDLLTRIQVSTPDPAADLMLNRWWLYQTLSCRIWGRSGFYQSSGAYGFRDQLQDVLALLNIEPSISRDQILNAAKHQFEEGDVLHWWHPPTGRGVRTRISDNLIWLPYVTSLYAAATGDSAIWDQKIPFLTAPSLKPDEMERYAEYEQTSQAFTIFEHCQRALHKGSTAGSHGMPLIGSGDWNDGFNKVGSRGRGESIWLTWFLIDTLKRFANVCEKRGMQEEAVNYRKQADDYLRALEEHAWDGEWYLRAFYDDGTPLGSHLSEACQIDAIAQSWSVISEAGDRERSSQAMNKVWERLTDTDNNLSLLFTPPFDKTSKNPGYIRNYPPGVRENGGQYTHAAAWTAWAYAKLGDSQRAWHLFDILNPIYQSDREDRANQYRVEPYVSSADIYSQGEKLRRGGWTWYTGSAGWLYRVGIDALLGLRRENDQLFLDPVIPSSWNKFTIRYRYLDTSFQIEVNNPDHVTRGIKGCSIDGKTVLENSIQLLNDGIDHKIEILMGN
jgi:cyclic beta-1,2-glucan synthetase